MARPVLMPRDRLVDELGGTPGVLRQRAFDNGSVWIGRIRNSAHQMSGWHVHPGHDTYAYCVDGRFVVEFGPGGSESISFEPGDFGLIPRGLVHREGNPAGDPNEGLVFRVGQGPVVVNLGGPEPTDG